MQETLLAIHNQRHTYDAVQPLTAWVHAIARYKLIDLLRRQAGRDALTGPLDEESEVFAASDVEAGDARRDLAKLLDRLPSGTCLACPSQSRSAQSLGRRCCAGKVSVGVRRCNVPWAARMY